MNPRRQHSRIDRLLISANNALSVLCQPARATRPFPSDAEEARLNPSEHRRSAGYMRVNHVGEVCAQALYQSQALIAQSESTRVLMKDAATEEIDHLAWCERRLKELNAHKSLLNPLWYAGSFVIGGNGRHHRQPMESRVCPGNREASRATSGAPSGRIASGRHPQPRSRGTNAGRRGQACRHGSTGWRRGFALPGP